LLSLSSMTDSTFVLSMMPFSSLKVSVYQLHQASTPRYTLP
jgi:hypothetical protein